MNIIEFRNITIQDLPAVGGKNASLGELLNNLSSSGINVADGFAVTASAYKTFLHHNHLEEKLSKKLAELDRETYQNLQEIGSACRKLINDAVIPPEIIAEIKSHFSMLQNKYTGSITVAVRSSGTAEDLPTASFAGQHDSFLNVKGTDVTEMCKRCYASMFNDRAIKYRVQMGFEHMKVSLSVGIQKMVRSDLASAGVAFTIEPETGFKDLIYITGVWGLGESIVQGTTTPDEFYIFKPSLRSNKESVITEKCGDKTHMLVFAEGIDQTRSIEVPFEKRTQYVLDRGELKRLGQWCLAIEEHYKCPMDIEWAKDGIDGQLYIVQARPETIHQGKVRTSITTCHLKSHGRLITTGKAVGNSIVTGHARIIRDPKDGARLKQGEILVTENTSPDWNAVLKKASVIVTNKGGRTSHASIVARELGLSAVVGTSNATELIKDGDMITVSCAEGDTGKIYADSAKWETKEIQISDLTLPHTAPMLILADPSKALLASFYPSKGVGLLRMEFIITNSVRIHPMALVKFDELKDLSAKSEIQNLTASYTRKSDYFLDRLSQGIAMIAAAFFPREVILRMSDFKTNEYASLLGGSAFEPAEENPMLGFRGASRYYHERYREGFRLECEAIKIVRNKMRFSNVKVMIPFCRTVAEGNKVLKIMSEFGLTRGENNLEVYVMAEIPSNVIQADEFARIFDGFSIGSNDLTQLTLGVDRDSEVISSLFSENDPSVKWMISTAIKKARSAGVKIGLCGQAPSDNPEFAEFLVDQGIQSISFNPDALLKGIENMKAAETKIKTKRNIIANGEL